MVFLARNRDGFEESGMMGLNRKCGGYRVFNMNTWMGSVMADMTGHSG